MKQSNRKRNFKRGSTFRTHSTSRVLALTFCSTGLFAGSFAFGQSNAELLGELRALKARVAELEAQQKQAPSAPPANRTSGNTKQYQSTKDNFDASPERENYLTMKRNDSLASRLELYGFARLDMILDNNQAGLDELLGWASSADQPGSGESDFYLYPKLTRIGANFDGPTLDSLGGAKVDGKIEVDFYKEYNSSDSRNALRMRHAYAKLTWDDFYILAGQTVDTISPLFPSINPDMIGWGLGNLGDRRPQFIAGFTPSMNETKFRFIGSVGQSGAVSSQQADDEVNYQALIGFDTPFNGSRFSLDFWGHYADEDGFESNGYGLSTVIPIYSDIITLKGEVWAGTNMDDIRGGIFQGVVGNTELDSKGGFAELGWKVNKTVSLHGGYMRDDPKGSQLIAGTGTGSRDLNETYYIGAHFNYDPIKFGIDYIRTDTEFSGAADGELDRIQTFIQYSF